MKKASLLLALIMMLTMLPIGGVAGEEEGHIHPLRMVTCKCGNGNVGSFDVYCSYTVSSYTGETRCTRNPGCYVRQGLAYTYWICHYCGSNNGSVHVHTRDHSHCADEVVCSLPRY